jgi:putative membrane protein
MKIALIVGGIVVAAVLVLSLVVGLTRGWQGYGYGMMWPDMMGGLGAMFFMPVLGIGIVGLVVWALVAAVRRPGEFSHANQSSESALEILKRRYARGEVTKDEFDAMKKDLV